MLCGWARWVSGETEEAAEPMQSRMKGMLGAVVSS